MKKLKTITTQQSELTPLVSSIEKSLTKSYNGKELTYHPRGSMSAFECTYAHWLYANKAQAKPLTARTINLFQAGHIFETYYAAQIKDHGTDFYKKVTLGKAKGELKIGDQVYTDYKQLESSFNFITYDNKPFEVICHFDGIGLTHDGVLEIFDVKTCSNYGYKEFIEGNVDKYKHQMHAYMMTDLALKHNIKRARIIAIRKETSHMYDQVIEYDDKIALDVMYRFKESWSAEPPTPLHTYEVNDEVKAFPCGYCNYLHKCVGPTRTEFKRDYRTGMLKPIIYKGEEND